MLERAKNAIVALTPNPKGHRNLSALVDDAIRREVARLERTYNDGEPFPQRRVELQPGRPLP